ncbi:hypothetical protein PI124_g12285 [Phytophthora idaei]|nr:hypothetical protein PI124_g12285 [Phytophthora idaei]
MHDKYENIATPARGENVKKGVENLDIAMVLIKRKDKGSSTIANRANRFSGFHVRQRLLPTLLSNLVLMEWV